MWDTCSTLLGKIKQDKSHCFNILHLCALFSISHFLNTSEVNLLSSMKPKSTVLSLDWPKFPYWSGFKNRVVIIYWHIINTPQSPRLKWMSCDVFQSRYGCGLCPNKVPNFFWRQKIAPTIVIRKISPVSSTTIYITLCTRSSGYLPGIASE